MNRSHESHPSGRCQSLVRAVFTDCKQSNCCVLSPSLLLSLCISILLSNLYDKYSDPSLMENKSCIQNRTTVKGWKYYSIHKICKRIKSKSSHYAAKWSKSVRYVTLCPFLSVGLSAGLDKNYRFQWNLDGGWVSDQNRHHLLMAWIWISWNCVTLRGQYIFWLKSGLSGFNVTVAARNTWTQKWCQTGRDLILMVGWDSELDVIQLKKNNFPKPVY